MKKILAVMLLAVSLVFIGGQDNQVEAYPQFVGNYPDNGDAAYLLTETCRGNRSNFSCTVETSRGDRIYYNFYYRNGRPYYTNSWNAGGYVFDGYSRVAQGIWNWVQSH